MQLLLQPFLKLLEHHQRLVVSTRADLLRLALDLLKHLLCPPLCLLDDLVLAHQGRGLLPRQTDDAFRLLFGLCDQPFPFGLHALGLFDLFWDRDSHLVDDIKEPITINHHARCQGYLAAFHQHRFQPVQKQLDFDSDHLPSRV